MNFPKDIEYLVQKYLDGELTQAEDQCLAAAVEQNEQVRNSLVEVMQFDDAISQNLDEFRSEEMFTRALKHRMEFTTHSPKVKKLTTKKKAFSIKKEPSSNNS